MAESTSLSNPYGIVGQPLTRDYLAKQLPMFQHKIPKHTQVQPHFPTSAPPNLPSPPLYPGEAIELQQDRVVCLDIFNEPAVGAVYITNFRVIFSGNLISDPESIDVLQDTGFITGKKDTTTGSEGGQTSKSRRTKNDSSNFVSFVTDPDTEMPEKPALLSTRKFRSGLAAKLGSIRRPVGRSPPKSQVNNRPLISSPQPIKLEVDMTDGATPNSSEELNSSLSTATEASEKKTAAMVQTTDDDTSPNLTPRSRRAIISNYHQDTVSLDSVSVSSQSEMSENLLTASGERCLLSAAEERCLLPEDMTGAEHLFIRSNGIASHSGDSNLESTLRSSESAESASAGTSIGTGSSHPLVQISTESDYDHLEDADVLPYVQNGILASHKNNRLPSVDFESIPGVEDHLLSSVTSQDVWKNSIIQLESDSDSETMNKEDDLPAKFTVGSVDSKEQFTQSLPESIYSKVDLGTPDKPDKQDRPDEANYYNFSVLVSEMRYANVFIPGPGGNAYGQSSAPVKRLRPRSKSSSPYTPKKPVPLPRKMTSGQLGQLTNESTAASERNVFVESLPANFKPQPPPKPTSLGGVNTAVSGQSPRDFSSSAHDTRSKNDTSSKSSPSLPGSKVAVVTSSGPSPQHSSSSESHTPVHSLAMNGTGGNEDGGDMPIPPPRRKRKSTRKRNVLSSKGSESSLDLVSPTEALHSLTGGQRSSTPPPNDSATVSSVSTSDQSHDHTSQSYDHTSQSPDPFSEEDMSSHDSVDCFDSNAEVVSRLKLSNGERNTSCSFLESTSDTPSSRTSLMAVIDSSSSGGGQRPYSVLVSPYDINAQFNFPEESSSRISGLITLPRGVAQTWSPRSQLLSKRQSQRSAQFPCSTRYTLSVAIPLYSIHSVRKVQPAVLKEQNIKLSEGLLFLCRNFHSLKLYIHPHNTYDADGLRDLMEKHFLVEKPLHDTFCFKYCTAIRHPNPTFLHNRSLPNFFHLSEEVCRLGLADSRLWSVSKLLLEHPDVCPSYPPSVIAPICTPEMDLIRGASLYCEGRFPTLTWVDRLTGAALLRAASTKEERGQGTGNLQGDETLLQAICGCNTSAKGRAKLYIFTEKSETKSTTSFNNPVRTEQVRTYYYHNCEFVYTVDPPTFKSIRHSFNKLQAMMENKLPDEHYLIALDTTRWLPRVSELLQTACAVCHALIEEAAHVLVCYGAGWDRTTQIVSLAQLLMDPYYRTMDGFQVLVQKEWVWFGHPFHLRHSRHGKAKEDGPIFLQWVDCVWQIMQQCPSAFEFNERFLVILVEHSYSGMFGSFVTNSESEQRKTFEAQGYQHMSVATHTVSFWTWVAMVNATGRNFFNELYSREVYPDVIYPNYCVPCLKLWTSHYCKHKHQENFSKVPPLQRRLEELLATYKRFESIAGQFSPSKAISLSSVAGGRPSTLTTKESLISLERSLELSSSSPSGNRRKPIPPPKPSKHQWDSVEQYLRTKGVDPSLCKHIELSATTCQGYLHKLGAVRKNWLQRWFVLDFASGDLAYFENKGAFSNKEPPKGVIHLSRITKVHQNIKKRDHLIKNIFTVETPGRTYYFQAPSIITMEQWIACLSIPLSSFR